MIETTDFLTKIMATPNKFPQALRDAVMPLISHVAPFHNALVQKLSELGIAYKGSPIVEGPGKEYFHDSMRGGKGIRSRFLLLVDDKEVPAKEAANQLCDSFSDVVELRPSRNPGLRLVRPDGYVAYSAHNGNSADVLGSMRSLLERQTRTVPRGDRAA